MIRIRTASIIKTSSEIRSFRSLRLSVGAPLVALDQGRIRQGQARRQATKDRLAWLHASQS